MFQCHPKLSDGSIAVSMPPKTQRWHYRRVHKSSNQLIQMSAVLAFLNHLINDIKSKAPYVTDTSCCEDKGGTTPKTTKIWTHICSPSWVAVLRRGGIKVLWSRLFSTPQLRGGGVHGKIKKQQHCITAKSFSNPHTDFGARRSRRLGVRSATN